MADVHAIQTYSLANIVTSLGLGGLIASLLGPLSFTTSFLLIEWYKMALVHFVGISNMSVLLQILIIMDIGWGKSLKSSIILTFDLIRILSDSSDSTVITATQAVGVSHLTINVLEYFQVTICLYVSFVSCKD